MVDVFIVRPADGLGSDFLDGYEVERFVEIKGRTLGYVEASIQTPIAAGQREVTSAPWGAVKSLEDAQRLIEALRSELPNKNFVVERRAYPDADRVEWHSFHAR
jgi:hypothetical protein